MFLPDQSYLLKSKSFDVLRSIIFQLNWSWSGFQWPRNSSPSLWRSGTESLIKPETLLWSHALKLFMELFTFLRLFAEACSVFYCHDFDSHLYYLYLWFNCIQYIIKSQCLVCSLIHSCQTFTSKSEL